MGKTKRKRKFWCEIRNDFESNNMIYIDAWKTRKDDEEGVVIAKINKDTKQVIYLNERAKTDEYAQKVVNETISSLGGKKSGNNLQIC